MALHPGEPAKRGQARPVFVTVSDPIGSGFAANLAHPGGNITGFTVDDSALGGKWVELLKEIAPRTARVGLLFNPAGPPLQFFMPYATGTWDRDQPDCFAT